MQAYKTLVPRFKHDAGVTVYMAAVHDYGLARDDTNCTGIEHVSVTLDPEGGYPFFTIPAHQLQPLPATEAA